MVVSKNEIKMIIQQVVEKLKAEYQPTRVILFGSYAYGEPREDSDIDLFIIKDTTQRRTDRFVEVKRIIYDPNRKISIMPLVYTPSEVKSRLSLGDSFVDEVLSRGKVLYG